jgi:hypothetical protein
MVQVLLVEEPDGTVSYLGNYNTGLQSWKDLDYDYEYQPYKIFLPVCMTIPILHHLTWDQYNCINEDRWGHGMAAVGGSIYVIGGMSKSMNTLSSIERFNKSTNKCEKVGDLKEAISSMTVAVKGSKIYTFGGKLNDRNASDLIQLYDVATGESNIIGSVDRSYTWEL